MPYLTERKYSCLKSPIKSDKEKVYITARILIRKYIFYPDIFDKFLIISLLYIICRF